MKGPVRKEVGNTEPTVTENVNITSIADVITKNDAVFWNQSNASKVKYLILIGLLFIKIS